MSFRNSKFESNNLSISGDIKSWNFYSFLILLKILQRLSKETAKPIDYYLQRSKRLYKSS